MSGWKLGIGGKIWSLVALLVAGLAVLAAQSLSSTRDTLMEDRRETLKMLVETAVSALSQQQARAAKGEITEAEAKKLAMEAVRAMRYGANDYFVITDSNVVTIMHPLRPDLDGKDMSQVKDVNGVYFARAQVEGAKKSGSVYVPYAFPRTKDGPPVPKLAYAQLFQPWGWTILTGVYIDDLDQHFRDKALKLGMNAAFIGLLAAALSILIARSITGPLKALIARMRGLADGDIAEAVTGTERKDEMGELARAMEVFRNGALENRRLIDQQEHLKAAAVAERAQALAQMADRLEGRVKAAVDAIGQVGRRLDGASDAMNHTAEQTSEQTGAVAAATEQTSGNVQTVASAAEELAASGNEISRQIALTAEIARNASQEAEQTNLMVSALSAAAGRIGEVVSLINDIASQTNLLALNATIEAARAGEAGKGFAVVANEVKALATQTGRATQEISAQISSVQGETDKAVAAIQRIGRTINQVDEATSSIAGAVEEQNAAIQEITRSVQEAARGTREVSEHIGKVSAGADTSRAAAQDVASSVREMVGQNGVLTSEIDSFLREIRSQAG